MTSKNSDWSRISESGQSSSVPDLDQTVVSATEEESLVVVVVAALKLRLDSHYMGPATTRLSEHIKTHSINIVSMSIFHVNNPSTRLNVKDVQTAVRGPSQDLGSVLIHPDREYGCGSETDAIFGT